VINDLFGSEQTQKYFECQRAGPEEFGKARPLRKINYLYKNSLFKTSTYINQLYINAPTSWRD